jgi:hypothetical protein
VTKSTFTRPTLAAGAADDHRWWNLAVGPVVCPLRRADDTFVVEGQPVGDSKLPVELETSRVSYDGYLRDDRPHGTGTGAGSPGMGTA